MPEETTSPNNTAADENKPATAQVTPPADKPGNDTPQTQVIERPKITDPKILNLFYNPPGTLRLTIGEGMRSYSFPTVRVYQAAPLSVPGKYLSVHDGKGDEIILVKEISEFTPTSQETITEEIRRRYLTAKVTEISNIKTEFGITYWHVITDRGERDFVVQSLSESCQWLSETHILLIDVDGNRFEIPDRTTLDALSEARLATVL